MKRTLCLVIALFVLVVTVTAVMAQESMEWEQYTVAFASYPGNESKMDVQVYDRAQGEAVYFKTVENVNVNHYHYFEVHHGNLYLLKEIGDTTGDNWAHELWLYSANEERLLFSSKGLDFRVAPNERFVALNYSLPPDFFYGALGFLDLASGEVIQEFAFEYMDESLSIGLENWSGDGRYLWVNFAHGPTPALFSSVNTEDWTVRDYDPGEVYIGSDYALDPNSGQIVFSDFPTFFDVSSANDFASSGESVSLFLMNLDSGATVKIAESVAKPFYPFWLKGPMIGYNDPASDGSRRSIYTILSGEVKSFDASQLSDATPAVIPEGFEAHLATLDASGIPAMLPAEFPVETSLPDIVPHFFVSQEGRYELSLDYGADCFGAGACHYGSMMAQISHLSAPIGTEYNSVNTWTAQKVILDKGIQGYFVESECGANCSDAQIFWVYQGFEYMVGLKGAPLDPVLALANAVITNSVP